MKSHCATKVILSFGVYSVSASPILSPPSACVYHPLNVAPFLVAVGNVMLFALYCAVNVSLFVPNIYSVPVKSVWSDFNHFSNVTVWISVNLDVSPPLELYLIVYPLGAFVGGFIDNFSPYPFVNVWVTSLPSHVPPLGFTDNVVVIIFHCAYKFKFSSVE